MRVVLHEVSKGRRGQALPATSLEYETGEVRYAVAETEQRPTVLGLIASGRMRPDSGRVTLDGASDASGLRRRVALVDAPEVSDPHADITLAGVVGEELMFAGLPATPIHARRWLAELGYADDAGAPIGTIDAAARVRILCELAALRKGVEGIVLVHPDRHGGSPDGWARIMTEFAERGLAVLVIVGGSAAAALERMPPASTLSETPDEMSADRRVDDQHADDDADDPGFPDPRVGPAAAPTRAVSAEEPAPEASEPSENPDEMPAERRVDDQHADDDTDDPGFPDAEPEQRPAPAPEPEPTDRPDDDTEEEDA